MLLFHEISLEFNEEKRPLNEMNTLILKKENVLFWDQTIKNMSMKLSIASVSINEIILFKNYYFNQ